MTECAISVDPGAWSIAWASWAKDGFLLECGLHKFQTKSEGSEWVQSRGHGWDVLVVEKPQIYQTNRKEIDENDLVDVATTVGMCYPLAAEIIEWYPRQWKGQVPKKVHHKKMKASALNPNDVAVLKAAKMYCNHNVLDAVGIGLRYFRRN